MHCTETIVNTIGDEKCQMKNLSDCDPSVLKNFTADFFFFLSPVVFDWLPSRGAEHSAWKYFSVYKILLCAGRTSSLLCPPAPFLPFIFFYTRGRTDHTEGDKCVASNLSFKSQKTWNSKLLVWRALRYQYQLRCHCLISFLSLDLAIVPFLRVWPKFSRG